MNNHKSPQNTKTPNLSPPPQKKKKKKKKKILLLLLLLLLLLRANHILLSVIWRIGRTARREGNPLPQFHRIVFLISSKGSFIWSKRSLVVRLSYFSFQPVHHDWCNKGYHICYPVCGMVHIKETLLLIGKSSPCCIIGFPLSLSEWSFTYV